ncbi:hypothetical protein QYS48_26230 [Marivirga arenosa]|uniref:Uncharacterized protein n=1 Tax=Marivirga arenosa TaxID=3059076 RepID=A0AA49GFV2_9BACT|nr:hypothetical protein [Marivirga sp. ABR2-2]WKK85382.1 hypothetical protein QYS48_26230 [Marivirga sp. ABR2-2]
MNKFCFVLVIMVLFMASCKQQPISQSKSEYQSPSSLNPEEQTNRYSRRAPVAQETWFFGLLKKKQKLDWGDQLVLEYYERMEENAKEKRKQAKEMEKPQYSDWTYFGHKRKPKKRPPEKMKFCEECGIRH